MRTVSTYERCNYNICDLLCFCLYCLLLLLMTWKFIYFDAIEQFIVSSSVCVVITVLSINFFFFFISNTVISLTLFLSVSQGPLIFLSDASHDPWHWKHKLASVYTTPFLTVSVLPHTEAAGVNA